MVLTSRYTMDARNPAARREIAALADLVGALRLPGGAHQRAAGTGVVTDLLILRRREPGRQPDATAWEQARMIELDGAQIPVNEYFLDHPESVLGQLRATGGTFLADDLAVAPAGDTIESFTRSLTRIAADAAPRGLTWTPPALSPHGRPKRRLHPTRTATWKRSPTARSPRSRTAHRSPTRCPDPRPPNCAPCSPCATAPFASYSSSPPQLKTPPIPNASAFN